MNFLNKQTNKYSKIINERSQILNENESQSEQPHITDCQIPKPSKDTYVFKDDKDTLIIKNNVNTFEYTQFDKHNHLMEISTINKSIIAKFSLEIVDSSLNNNTFLYDCIIQSKDCIILDLNDLPYEPAIALYNFIYLHTQSKIAESNSIDEVEKKPETTKPIKKQVSRKKVTFTDEKPKEIIFPNTPTSEIYGPDANYNHNETNLDSRQNLKQAQFIYNN